MAFVYALVMLTWYYGTSRKQQNAQKNAVALDVRNPPATCMNMRSSSIHPLHPSILCTHDTGPARLATRAQQR